MDYLIDDVAKQTGLTKRAIRYYEEMGLLIPPERSEGGYRLYSDQHIAHLKKMMLAREVLGFSLQDLQHYLQIDERIQQHRQNYHSSTNQEERRAELEQLAQALAHEIALIEQKMARMAQFKEELAAKQKRVQDVLQTSAAPSSAAEATKADSAAAHSSPERSDA